MGRKKIAVEPIPPSYLRECFFVRDDGMLCWRARPPEHFGARPDDVTRFAAIHAGQPAGFLVSRRPVIRVMFGGKVKRVALLRAAWAVTVGAYPDGAVLPRDGDPWNAAPTNLLLTRFGAKPFQPQPARAKSLADRAAADRKLIDAVAANPDQSIAQISRLVGVGKGCTCHRLGKLQAGGLLCGPRCNPAERWRLAEAGREFVASSQPVLLDDLDKRILGALARQPAKPAALARQIGSCPMTARRRVNLLIGKKMVEARDGKFAITDAGLAALPDAPQRWVRPEMVSAALSRDVVARCGSDMLTKSEAGRLGGMATARAQRAMAG